MNIDKFKSQHVEILSRIASLRKLTHAGIEENAPEIARELISMSTIVKGHLAIEDRILYPSLLKDEGAAMAAMSKTYREEMKGIASAYIAFARHWSTPAQLFADPQKFRDEANTVLKTVHRRIVKENTEFYPAIEAL